MEKLELLEDLTLAHSRLSEEKDILVPKKQETAKLWRNKGTKKQRHHDFSKLDASTHCPSMYQVSILKTSQLLRKV